MQNRKYLDGANHPKTKDMSIRNKNILFSYNHFYNNVVSTLKEIVNINIKPLNHELHSKYSKIGRR